MMKIFAICLLSAVLFLSSCGKAEPAESPSVGLSAAENAVPNETDATASELLALSAHVEALEARVESLSLQTEELAVQRELLSAKVEYLSAELSKSMRAPIDFNDLDMVNREVIDPLIPPAGIWYYSWPTVRDIKADHLLYVLGYNNYFGLPRDSENCYLPESMYQPAESVEREIMARFDVEREYLRTSGFYQAEEHTYILPGGFSGTMRAVAISTEQKDEEIFIRVGIYNGFVDDRELTRQYPDGVPQEVLLSAGLLAPVGTLAVRTREDNTVEYLSYQFDEAYPWTKMG